MTHSQSLDLEMFTTAVSGVFCSCDVDMGSSSAAKVNGIVVYSVWVNLSAFLAPLPLSVSAQDGIIALGKAHTHSAPCLRSLPKVALETVPIFAWLNTDRSQLGGWNVSCFLSPLLFPSGNQCCDALACLC